ncbi:glycosylated lysosomal membrane protein-like [Clytia hemisphaerica]|uniref:Uncharacterized protein n=1 Tax=Clytia hemisphaerica TaxID=252671 RepID=A0A7M5XAE0_9CNID
MYQKYLINIGSILLLILSFTFAKKYEVTRTIEQKHLNVKCKDRTYTIAHFTATREGKGYEHDVIHYIVSAKHRPTVIIRHVFKDVSFKIDNITFCNQTGQSVIFSDNKNNPQYSGLVIANIFPYNDGGDIINLPSHSSHIDYDKNALDNIEWKIDGQNLSGDTVTFTGTSNGMNDDYNKTSLHFKISVRKSDGFEDELPGYPKDANLTQYDLKMKDLPKNSNYTNMRYAVETVMFSINNQDVKSSPFELAKSIDDEHSPGVFETWAATLQQDQPAQMTPCQSFISWKPVAYSGETPGFENKALAYNNWYTSGSNEEMPNSGHLSAYSGDVPWSIASHDVSNFFAVNVTFGVTKDGGYGGYIQWSGLIGSGKPPVDISLSDFAVTVITLGLAGPFVAGFLLAIFVWIIRRLWKSNSAKSKHSYASID